MIVFESKKINTTFNSIPLENISAFDKNSAYIKGTQRIYDNKIYEALTDITPTVQFVWNSTDVSNKFGYDLYNNIKIPDPTAVYCTTSTIVWSIRNKKYYQAKANGYVNFMTENPVTPSDFNDLGATPTPLYRTELNYPDGKKNTLYWEYKYGTNRNTIFDGVINKRTINNRFFTTSLSVTFSNTGTITLSEALSSNIFEEDKILITGTSLNDGVYKITDISVSRLIITLDRLTTAEVTSSPPISFYTQTYIKWVDFGVNAISIFNTLCDSAELKVTSGSNTDTYNFTFSDTSFITTFEIFCFNEPKQTVKNFQEIRRDYNQNFELTFFGTTQEIGEIVQGTSLDIGKAEDSMDLSGKNYNPLVEAENGDVYLQDENSIINIATTKSISLVYNSNETALKEQDIKDFMSKRIVLAGNIGNESNQDILLAYCFITNYRFNPVVNDELNKYTLDIREFL